MEAIKLGKNGQLAIPRAVMKRLNLKGDETLLLEVSDDGVIRLRPAAVLPIEIYSEKRIREFESETTGDFDALLNQLRAVVRNSSGDFPANYWLALRNADYAAAERLVRDSSFSARFWPGGAPIFHHA